VNLAQGRSKGGFEDKGLIGKIPELPFLVSLQKKYPLANLANKNCRITIVRGEKNMATRTFFHNS